MGSRYEIIIFWSKEDKAFIAEVSELPGCMADGQTYQEALSNAEQIIQEWIETAEALGRAIPEPRGRLAYAWKWVTFLCQGDDRDSLGEPAGTGPPWTRKSPVPAACW